MIKEGHSKYERMTVRPYTATTSSEVSRQEYFLIPVEGYVEYQRSRIFDDELLLHTHVLVPVSSENGRRLRRWIGAEYQAFKMWINDRGELIIVLSSSQMRLIFTVETIEDKGEIVEVWRVPLQVIKSESGGNDE